MDIGKILGGFWRSSNRGEMRKSGLLPRLDASSEKKQLQTGFTSQKPESGSRFEEYTGTKSEYGASTWTNQQIIIDTLQNAIDAEMEKYKKYLLSKFFTAEQIKAIETELNKESEVSRQLTEDVNILLREVYYFVIHGSMVHEQDKQEIVERINWLLQQIFRLCGWAQPTPVSMETLTGFEKPARPEITYAVYDVKNDKIVRDLTQKDLFSGKYSSQEEYPLFEFKVVDRGSGFDPLLTTKYISTKKENELAIGNKGEGGKVNQAAISRIPGVMFRIASVYNRHDGGQAIWTRSPFVKDGKMYHRGRTVIGNFNLPTGTVNIIRFKNPTELNPHATKLAASLDPRQTNIGEIALCFREKQNHRYLFDPSFFPGISLEDTNYQYVQGLAVGTGLQGFVFSYDFPDRRVLPGRDRSNLDRSQAEFIVKVFWNKVIDCGEIDLLTELFRRVFAQKEQEFKDDSYEKKWFLENLHKLDATHLISWIKRWPKMLGMKADGPNFIWPTVFDFSLEKDLIAKTCNVVHLSCLGLTVEQYNQLVDLIKKHCPEYRLISIEEARRLSVTVVDVGRPTDWTDLEKERNAQIVLEAEKVKREVLKVVKCYSYSPRIYQIISRTSFSLFAPGAEAVKSDLEIFIRKPDEIRIIVPKEVKLPLDAEIICTIRRGVTIALLCLSCLSQQDESASIPSGSDINVEHGRVKRYAQWFAQDCLWLMSQKNESLIPEGIYETIHKQMVEQALGKAANLDRTAEEEEIVRCRQLLNSSGLTQEDQMRIFNWLSLKIGQFSSQEDMVYRGLYWQCVNSVVVTGNTIHYFQSRQTEKGSEIFLVSQEKKKLEKIGVWQGYNVYKVTSDIETDQSFVWVDVPLEEGSLLLERSSGKKIFISGGQFWEQHGRQVSRQANHLDESLHEVMLGAGGVFASSLNSLDDLLLQPKISFEPNKVSKAEFESRLVSPVTLEYIDAVWNKQQRLVLDIWSNHDDAHKDGVRERFLVERKGVRVWVSEKKNENDIEGLQEDEQILGYEVADKGLGYSPEGINDMGHTLKRNPLLTGKNGEGLKLVAASALKQGLELQYASTCQDENGNKVAWTADARAIPEEFTDNGKKRIANSLAFDLKKQQDLTVLSGNTSFTRVVLPPDEKMTRSPDGKLVSNREHWKNWLAIIDPRIKDKFGNGGTRRMILGPVPPEKKESDRRIRVGPVEVLLDRPGEIYENGKLVTNKQQGSRKYQFGWNFPSISSTRERDRFDEDLAMSYIKIFMEGLQDEAVIAEILKRNFQNIQDEEFDISLALNELGKDKMQLSFPVVRRVASNLYPGKTLFNVASFEKLHGILKGNLNHIPEEDRIYVGNTVMPNAEFGKFMPNMHSFLSSLDGLSIKIDVPESDLEHVRKQVISQLDTWERFLGMIAANPQEKAYLDFILAPSLTLSHVLTKLKSFRGGISPGGPTDVFVGHDDNNWYGLAGAGIGINIKILAPGSEKRLVATIDHEIVHKITDLPDYDPTFVLFLFYMATFKYYGKDKWPGLE